MLATPREFFVAMMSLMWNMNPWYRAHLHDHVVPDILKVPNVTHAAVQEKCRAHFFSTKLIRQIKQGRTDYTPDIPRRVIQCRHRAALSWVCQFQDKLCNSRQVRSRDEGYMSDKPWIPVEPHWWRSKVRNRLRTVEKMIRAGRYNSCREVRTHAP